MYKGIIFDLDGVICTTDEYHYLAWKELAERLKIPFDRDINKRLLGVSRMESLEIILEKSSVLYTDNEKQKMAEEKNKSYQKLLMQMKKEDLSPEVYDTLNELRKRGYKLAIGSSSKNTKIILKQLGSENFFDAISDGTNISNKNTNQFSSWIREKTRLISNYKFHNREDQAVSDTLMDQSRGSELREIKEAKKFGLNLPVGKTPAISAAIG